MTTTPDVPAPWAEAVAQSEWGGLLVGSSTEGSRFARLVTPTVRRVQDLTPRELEVADAWGAARCSGRLAVETVLGNRGPFIELDGARSAALRAAMSELAVIVGADQSRTRAPGGVPDSEEPGGLPGLRAAVYAALVGALLRGVRTAKSRARNQLELAAPLRDALAVARFFGQSPTHREVFFGLLDDFEGTSSQMITAGRVLLRPIT